MRVLHLIDPGSPDGGPCTLRLLADVMRHMTGVQHEALIVGSLDDLLQARRCGVLPIGSFCPPRALPWGGRRSLQSVLHERQRVGGAYDLIHAWTARTAALAQMAAPSVPGIATLHSGVPNALGTRYAARVFHRGDQPLLAASTAVRREYRSRGLVNHRIALLPPAVDATIVASPRERLRQEWSEHAETDIAPATFVVALLGEPASWIDARAAVQIIARAALSGRDVKLLMHPATAFRAEALGMLRRLGLAHMTVTSEAAGEPWQIAPGLDAALLVDSVWRERPASSPLPALWALAGGAPIVAEMADGWRDLLDHGNTALFFNPGDINAAAESIVRLHDDRELRARLSESGRQLIADDFGIEDYCERLQHAYELRLANRTVRTVEDSGDAFELEAAHAA